MSIFRTPSQPPAVNPAISAVSNPLAWTGWVAAACFAVATAYFGTHYFASQSEAELLGNDAELSKTEAQSLAQRLEAERILSSGYIAQLQKSGDVANLQIAKLTDTLGNSPQTLAIAIWNPLSQTGALIVDKLPGLSRDQEYQLWITAPAYKEPVNGALFTVDEKGTARVSFRPNQNVTAATTFTITRERKSGASKPEGPIVATGTL